MISSLECNKTNNNLIPSALGIPPLPLDAEQTIALCELLQHPPAGEEANLLALLRDLNI